MTEALLLPTSLPLRTSEACPPHFYLSILTLLYHSFIPCHHLFYSKVLAIQRSPLSLHLSLSQPTLSVFFLNLSAQSEVRISFSFSLINPSHLSLLTCFCVAIPSSLPHLLVNAFVIAVLCFFPLLLPVYFVFHFLFFLHLASLS